MGSCISGDHNAGDHMIIIMSLFNEEHIFGKSNLP